MDDTQTPDEVIEVETEEVTTEVAPATSDAEVLMSLEEMIKNNIESIDKLKDELKKHREMFEDTFNNSPTYREKAEKVKEVNKEKSQTRSQIMNQPSVLQLSNKIKTMRSDMKERQSALSDYLKEYQRMTGATEIEGRDGKIREIVSDAKLIVRSDKGK